MRCRFYLGVKFKLQIYILNNIIPKYRKLDKAHGIKHIEYVIKRSIVLARNYRLDLNMAYCIAAFHDIGMLEDRIGHEEYGAEILENDSLIKKQFNREQIDIMKYAIKEHRASYKGKYTSIYSKVISEADRSFDIYLMTYRSIAYGMAKFPSYSYEQHFNRTYDYLKRKYGKDGYARMVLYYEPDAGKLEQIRQILESRDMFSKVFNECYKKCIEEIAREETSDFNY